MDAPDGESEMNVNLFLLKRFEWKLCQFFTSIGLRQHGEKLRMNWAAVTGKTAAAASPSVLTRIRPAQTAKPTIWTSSSIRWARVHAQAGGFTPGAF